MEKSGLPFAPIKRPEDLSEDEHMQASDGLVEVTLDNEKKIKLPALPMEMNKKKFTVRKDIPKSGQHTNEILAEAGFEETEINEFINNASVAADSS